jgi:hypothetical protein
MIELRNWVLMVSHNVFYCLSTIIRHTEDDPSFPLHLRVIHHSKLDPMSSTINNSILGESYKGESEMLCLKNILLLHF